MTPDAPKQLVSLEPTAIAECETFDAEQAEEVVRRVAAGKGWVTACQQAEVDPITAWHWRALNVDSFRYKLEIAEKLRIERMFEDLIEGIEALPQTLTGRLPAHIKARMDFLKTFASRLAPGRYSEKVRVQHQLIGAGEEVQAAVVIVPQKDPRISPKVLEAEVIEEEVEVKR